MSVNAKMTVKHAIGVTPHIKNGLSFTDERYLTYICGHQVVVLNTETKDQNFISAISGSGGISAVACSTSKKFIAVADKMDPVGIVTFYDSGTLRRKKVLHFGDLGSREIICIAFSEDGKSCLTMGAGPEWNLVLWNVEKAAKIITWVKISISDETPVNQVSFCPSDPGVIIVLGKSIMRLFRLVDGQLRPTSLSVRRDHANFLSHVWLPEEKLLIGTEGGEILLIDNMEFRAVVYPTGSDMEDITPVLSLTGTARGFVAGSTDGELRVFERQEDIKEQYRYEESFILPKAKGKITNMCNMGSDDVIICLTNTQQIFQFPLNHNVGGAAGNLKDHSSVHGHTGFDHLVSSFHEPNGKGDASITGLDTALWRPVLASCGKDCTIRLWSVNDRKIEMMKEFSDEPTSISVHPSGIYVVAGFAEHVKLLSVLLDDLCVCREFNVRHCSYVKFSNGGQYIAAVSGSTIHIFNTYTGVLIGVMRGHNGRPRSVTWLNFDSKLMSVGAEGNVFFWDVLHCTRLPEQYVGIVPFISGTGTPDGSKIYSATPDKFIHEVSFCNSVDPLSGVETHTKEGKDVDIGRVVSLMHFDVIRKCLLLTTAEDDRPGGVVSIMTAPSLSSTFEVTDLHAGPITAMCLSYDGAMMVTGDTCGCIVITEMDGVSNKFQAKPREGIASYDLVEEVLIQRTDLEARKSKINELTARVEELTLNNEHQLRLKEIEHNNRIKGITEKFSGQLTSESEKYETLSMEKMNVELYYSDTTDVQENKQDSDIENVNTKYKAKLNNEAVRHKSLLAETEAAHEHWNLENQELVKSHQGFLQQLTEEYEERLFAEHDTQKRLHHEKDSLQINFDVTRDDVEFDCDVEIEDMKAKYESRLLAEESLGVELMAQHALMKKNLQNLNKEADLQKEEIKRLKDKELRLLETIRSLEKDIQSHKKEIREREETITDKEKRIFDLKKKNQELEKFRFVLDYKIKELKLQIAPREHEIATMRKQIDEMDLELEQYHRSNQSLNLMIGELKLKMDGLRKELSNQGERVAKNGRLIEKYRRDLQDTSKLMDDYPALKMRMIFLYRIYVQQSGDQTEDSSSSRSDGNDAQEIYNRDREQMERNLDALRRGLKTDSLAHRRDLGKMMRENVILTKELNQLRKESRAMEIQRKSIGNANINDKDNIAELMASFGIKQKKPMTTVKASNPSPVQRRASAGVDGRSGSKVGTPVRPNSTSGEFSPAPPTSALSGPRRTITSAGPRSRSAALRTTSAGGQLDPILTGPASKNDRWEAWREIQMQTDNMHQLEDHIRTLCTSLNIDPDNMLERIDSNLLNSVL